MSSHLFNFCFFLVLHVTPTVLIDPAFLRTFRFLVWLKTDQTVCSGIIWNEDTILTAGSCLLGGSQGHPEQLGVYLAHGQVDLLSYDTEYEFKVGVVKRERDLGLLKLEKRMDFRGKHFGASCVCDPEPHHNLDHISCFLLGWGRGPQNQDPATHCYQAVVKYLPVRLHSQDSNFIYADVTENAQILPGSPILCPVSTTGVISFVGITISQQIHPGINNSLNISTYSNWIAAHSAEVD